MNAHDFTKGVPALRQLTALTDADIRRVAPSVFANEPQPGASARYQFVRTIDVIETMRSEGWEVIKVSQSAAKEPGAQEYVKHLVRLMHRDYIDGRLHVGDFVPTIGLTNSHNRTSAFELMAALDVLACNNGLMLPSAQYGRLRVLHNDPHMQEHILDGTDLVREVHENHALPNIERMKQIELSPSQALQFATGATLLKWGEKKPDHAEHLLTVRRAEDDGNSLWQVFQRVQENAMKGGYTAKDRAGRNITAAGINSVARDIDFNAALWTYGNRVLEIVSK